MAATTIQPVSVVRAHHTSNPWITAIFALRKKPMGLVSLFLIIGMTILGLFAPWIAPYDPVAQNYSHVMKPPSTLFWLGTDNLGRDLLSRMIHGARISLQVGVAAVFISTVGGALLGLMSGFLEGKVDLYMQRVMDAWMSFPQIIFTIALLAALGPGIPQTMLAIGITGIPGTNRVVRGAAISEKHNMYVEAARSLGASQARVMLMHVMPNVAAPILVIASLTLGRSILAEASLSFLGLGVQPPNPAWGSMLSGHSRTYMLAAPWMAIWPGVAISLAVLSWNLLGDALRDVLDPRLRGR